MKEYTVRIGIMEGLLEITTTAEDEESAEEIAFQKLKSIGEWVDLDVYTHIWETSS